MRILFISAELYPLAKAGGLADVAAGLPFALRRLGVDTRVLLPGYAGAFAAARDVEVAADLGEIWGAGPVRLLSALSPEGGLPLWLLDCPKLFARPGGPYQDEAGNDWPDNALRFALFSYVGARLAAGRCGIGWSPDLVHANDWHTGLTAAFLAREPVRPPTVFTVHNLPFQGNFQLAELAHWGVPLDGIAWEGVEFHGNISYLKAGLWFSNRLTTVSPTYAREILTPEYGCGMDGLLRARAADLVGILNGVDEQVWNPATDPHLAARFDAQDLVGKRACKRAVQEELGLGVDRDSPLVVFVNRVTHQKMADVVAEGVEALLAEGAQFVLHGRGERCFEEPFRELGRKNPGRVAVVMGYEEGLAHRLFAGGDIALAASRYEPCGLTPRYAMRYGTLPVVRLVGGLADTVVDAAQNGSGTGFAFTGLGAADLVACCARAFALRRQPLAWRKLQLRAMKQDLGWGRRAETYLALYRASLGETGSEAPESATVMNEGLAPLPLGRVAANGPSTRPARKRATKRATMGRQLSAAWAAQ